jgi:hypothetical protein
MKRGGAKINPTQPPLALLLKLRRHEVKNTMKRGGIKIPLLTKEGLGEVGVKIVYIKI